MPGDGAVGVLALGVVDEDLGAQGVDVLVLHLPAVVEGLVHLRLVATGGIALGPRSRGGGAHGGAIVARGPDRLHLINVVDSQASRAIATFNTSAHLVSLVPYAGPAVQLISGAVSILAGGVLRAFSSRHEAAGYAAAGASQVAAGVAGMAVDSSFGPVAGPALRGSVASVLAAQGLQRAHELPYGEKSVEWIV